MRPLNSWLITGVVLLVVSVILTTLGPSVPAVAATLVALGTIMWWFGWLAVIVGLIYIFIGLVGG